VNKGSSAILIVVVLALLLVGACAGAYYYLNSQGKIPGTNVDNSYSYTLPLPTAQQESGAVSPNNDLNTIETELNNTNESSTDADLKELDSESSSL
jgi:flagellar basal body-associated protein FliL